jgi:hypothetical protein
MQKRTIARGALAGAMAVTVAMVTTSCTEGRVRVGIATGCKDVRHARGCDKYQLAVQDRKTGKEVLVKVNEKTFRKCTRTRGTQYPACAS